MSPTASASSPILGGSPSAAELARWRHPEPARLARDLALIWVQALAGVGIFLAMPGAISYGLALLLIAGAQHGLNMVAHEGVHFLLVPRSRLWNDRIATWLFSAPVFLPFRTYRERHFDHHRHVSTPEDSKFVYRRSLRGLRFPFEVLRSVSGVDPGLQIVRALARYGRDHWRQKPNRAEAVPGALGMDAVRVLAVQGVIFGAFWIVDPFWGGVPTLYFLLWVVPNFTVLPLFGKLRSVVEHQPLARESGDDGTFFGGTPAPFVRSVTATPLERLFLSKLSFHYHAEHHVWPAVSYQHLMGLHARLRADPSLATRLTLGFETSYAAALSKLVRGE